PIPIMTFELVFETDLLGRDQAESGVVDLQIATQCGQAQVRRCRARQVLPTRFAIGGDLLDVHRRREFVEGKVTRIDDADAVERQEPYPPVRGLGNARSEAGGERMAPDSVGT